MPARHAGYDAIEQRNGVPMRLQIKGRCVDDKAARSQRIGAIDSTKEFDAVILVLLDANYDAFAMYEAPRSAMRAALSTPGSKARNVRRPLAFASSSQYQPCDGLTVSSIRVLLPDSRASFVVPYGH
jgi:hypothetical protein